MCLSIDARFGCTEGINQKIKDKMIDEKVPSCLVCFDGGGGEHSEIQHSSKIS